MQYYIHKKLDNGETSVAQTRHQIYNKISDQYTQALFSHHAKTIRKVYLVQLLFIFIIKHTVGRFCGAVVVKSENHYAN